MYQQKYLKYKTKYLKLKSNSKFTQKLRNIDLDLSDLESEEHDDNFVDDDIDANENLPSYQKEVIIVESDDEIQIDSDLNPDSIVFDIGIHAKVAGKLQNLIDYGFMQTI